MAQQLETQKVSITKFNKWVEEQVAIFQSRGKAAHDLLTYLWKNLPKGLGCKICRIHSESMQRLHHRQKRLHSPGTNEPCRYNV